MSGEYPSGPYITGDLDAPSAKVVDCQGEYQALKELVGRVSDQPKVVLHVLSYLPRFAGVFLIRGRPRRRSDGGSCPTRQRSWELRACQRSVPCGPVSRSHRGLRADADWADPERLASSAGWLADADEAIEWALAGQIATRLTQDAAGIAIDPNGLPRELQRRLLLTAFDRLSAPRPRGPELDRALAALTSGKAATLSGLKLVGGEVWRLSKETRRRR